MALCLKTSSLQSWKCETVIDHFNREPFVWQASGRTHAKSRFQHYSQTTDAKTPAKEALFFHAGGAGVSLSTPISSGE